MTSKTEVKKQEPRYKQPRDIEYFFRENLNGVTIDQQISFFELAWCALGWFEKKDGVMVFLGGEKIKSFRKPFYKDDDKTKDHNYEILYVNSNGVVINDDDYDSLVKDKEDKLLPDFQTLYEQHCGVSSGKLYQMTINYRNGTPKFIGCYEDEKLREEIFSSESRSTDERVIGKRNGVFIFQNEHGCSVGGEYKDNELIKTYSGLMTISTMQ
tara:strand:+ start:85 stop:720 length:636 start_codon:yes stop_codon:yes gene_type:complete